MNPKQHQEKNWVCTDLKSDARSCFRTAQAVTVFLNWSFRLNMNLIDLYIGQWRLFCRVQFHGLHEIYFEYLMNVSIHNIHVAVPF